MLLASTECPNIIITAMMEIKMSQKKRNFWRTMDRTVRTINLFKIEIFFITPGAAHENTAVTRGEAIELFLRDGRSA